MSAHKYGSIHPVRLLGRWWVRAALYVAFVTVAAWSAYHLAYRYYGGPHLVDSEADVAFLYAMLWVAGMSAVVVAVATLFEALRLSRRSSESSSTSVA
jgi:hypothetical protein